MSGARHGEGAPRRVSLLPQPQIHLRDEQTAQVAEK